MDYTPVYTKPYSGGWKNLPDQSTPVYASTLDSYDNAFEHIENYLVEVGETLGDIADILNSI